MTPGAIINSPGDWWGGSSPANTYGGTSPYLQAQISYQNHYSSLLLQMGAQAAAITAPVASAKAEPEEFAWLRWRVEELLWKKA